MPELETESVRDSINAAMLEIEEANAPDDLTDDVIDLPEDKPSRARDETGKFAAETPELVDTTVVDAPLEPVVQEVKEPAPQGWTPQAKAEWDKVPANIRAEITRREQEIHKEFTAPDGALRLGREMKEVVTPYMQTINTLGVTAPVAVQHLLNTDHKLRNGSPEQKMEVVRAIFNDYKIDPSFLTQQRQPQEQIHPAIQQLQQEIAHLKQVANPEVIQNQLQERMEHDKVVSEWNAFAADPKHVHLEAVKQDMVALLGSGSAKSYQEAYDSACWARPEIRSTLLNQQKAEEQAKRQEQVKAKKQASVSVSGSPGIAAPTSTAPQKTLREELSEQFDAQYSNSI